MDTLMEISSEDAEIDAAFYRIICCIKAILRKHGHKKPKKFHKGTIRCPICKKKGIRGTLKYSISHYNGHIHGHCTAKNCVDWIQ